ncbi:hypothetical protein [Methyloprofundus sp.]|uniref:hypothetical protein n=1 Tax=Methyloprofundus sp. TaxID=2020875 RepID=UPI003D0F7535
MDDVCFQVPYVEVDQNISAILNKQATSNIISQLQALNQSLGDDYLAFKLKYLLKYYSHKTTKTDDDMLTEALMEKYAK